MKFFFLFLLILPLSFFTQATEITVIELHNKSIDEIVTQSLIQKESKIDSTQIEDSDVSNVENVENEENEKIIDPLVGISSVSEISEISLSWEGFIKDDFLFLLNNIDSVYSNVLKNELISILNINNTVPDTFQKDEFNKIIIDSLITLGDKKKSFEIIQSFELFEDIDLNSFYNKFQLNYLLSIYSLSEACDFREKIKSFDLESINDYLLKIDIFCLVLNEKFDEARLLNALLQESNVDEDQYFQQLFNKLQSLEYIIPENKFKIDEDNIFLYSAMHRIGEIPLTQKFLEIDSANLAIPIILSNSTNIDLRLRAAHKAYFDNNLNINSLAALYQTVDFTSNELNNPSKILPKFDNKIELGMAYYFQLINIQILPISRLEAILNFWDFAKINNLELIAYNLSKKNLDTIQPSSEFALYGSKIAKAYTYSQDYLSAEKWLLFSEELLEGDSSIFEFNSSKLLLNLSSINEDESFANILFENLDYMNKELLDKNNINYFYKNDLLYKIFSSLNHNKKNPYEIEKKIFENKLMPSLYIINLIRDSFENKNYYKLLLSITASMNGKKWNELHPEHFYLIIECLTQYKDGEILNDILLEVLKQSKII